MTGHEFYLSSHDFGEDCQPRKCDYVHIIRGSRNNSNYLMVRVTPPIVTRFWDGPTKSYDKLVLAIAEPRSVADVGVLPVIADIVICPMYSGGALDEKECSRIGVGLLHGTYAEALKNSPVEQL